MRIFSAVLLAFAIAYGIAEWRRWSTPALAKLLSPAQKVRRVSCYVALLLVLGMAFGGTFFPSGPHLGRHIAAIELFYWLGCLCLAVIVPVIALIEHNSTLKQDSFRQIAADRDEALRRLTATAAQAQSELSRREELPQRNGHE